ncbi:acetyl-CoA acetyltransferase [Salinisphaera orenii MK-B5]|uniref:acetyl-CoA C-acyltransferase n=1 Tax=Salinisphaera orenii MK-B5 TaxID=856730 RepID=A0A423PQT3_9GAMM|nr:3-oxoadipyl-CoA thiolase [Salinisphaera orenii]ROO27975.1 acetyl-CoA acetyltransferase [Salinisphaera orenii MK-B5]
MLDAYIYDGVRTAFGRHAGALAPVRPDDMLAAVIRTLVERNPFSLGDYEDVVAGCTNQAGEDARNVARHAGLLAGLPVEVAGQTVNRLCGSGLAATVDAARAVTVGEGKLVIAGGVESMSRAPFVMAKAETAYSRNMSVFDSTIGARFPNPKILAEYGSDAMPETAQNVADDFGISREAADAYAAQSQARYEAARADGFFDDEIMPLDVPQGRKQPPLTVDADEHPRPTSTADKLAKLPPIVANGIITAGNASGVNDGAGALIVGSRAAGEAAGLAPRARIIAGGVVGVPPRVMGLGPIGACNKVLERAGLSLSDMDVIEINEAFAAQVLGCCKELGLSADDERLNPNGGAIAVGHPLGASGSRLALTGLRQLERVNGRYALISLCIGIGQGVAMLIERNPE